MQHHIFLSYSRKDADVMRRVRESLIEEGLSVWTDEGIEPGALSWKDDIESSIEKAGCIVVMLSPDAKHSEWVKREIDYAAAQKIRIFSLLVRGDESSSIPFALIGSQYVDIRLEADRQLKLHKFARSISEALQNVQSALIDKKRTLVVEDSEDFQEKIRGLCLEFGSTVDIASTRIEAAQFIKDVKYDLITLDMQLSAGDTGGESGKFLLALWKRYQPNTPLIIISHLDWNVYEMHDFYRTYEVLAVLDKKFDEKILELLDKYLG